MALVLKSKSYFMFAWGIVIVLCSAAWSFNLISFMDAKGTVLAAALCIIGGLYCLSRQFSGKGFSVYLCLWLGLVVWLFFGIVTARVLSYHVEKAIYLGLMLTVASLSLEIFRHPRGRIWLLRFILISCAAVGILALLQFFRCIDFLLPPFPGYTQRAYSVFGNQNLLGGYMAMGLALLASLFARPGHISLRLFLLYLVAFVILSGALLVSETRSAWLAAVVGCSWALVQRGVFGRHSGRFFKSRPRILVLTLILVCLLLFGFPFFGSRIGITFSENDVGGNSRIWFWAGAVHMIAAAPLLGHGLGNYLFWSPYYQGKALASAEFYRNELHTIHAHSEPLEFLAETGVVGCLFLVVLAFLVFRRNRFETPGIIALVVFACFNTISHSPPHVLAGLLLVGSLLMRNTLSSSFSRRVSRLLAIVIIVVFTSGYAVTTVIPSLLLNQAEQIHVSGGFPEVYYLHTLHWPWPNPQAHESYAIALMDAGRYDAAAVQLAYAAEGLDTGRLHLLQARCAAKRGDHEAVLFHAYACRYRWPDNEEANFLIYRYNAQKF